MKKFGIIVSVIGLILTAIMLYYQVFYNPNVNLEVRKVNETLLTKPLNIDGLTASYYYHDTVEVKSLWQSTYFIKNIGSKTILGSGFQNKNIRNDYITLHFNDDCQILSITLNDCNNEASLWGDKLYFSQWKPNEFVEVIVVGDGVHAPDLTINDREIVDADVSYTEYSPAKENADMRLIDYLPKGLANILKWSVVAIIFGLTIYSIVAFLKQFKDIKGVGIRFFTIIVWLILVVLFAIPLLWIF